MKELPFDVQSHMNDAQGNPIRFITDPLAEHYIEPPGDWVPAGMLPPEEFQVRAALVEMKIFTDLLHDLGIFGRLFNSTEYKKRYKLANEKQNCLRQLVNSSREHKAALRRIVNAMPTDNGGREALLLYTK